MWVNYTKTQSFVNQFESLGMLLKDSGSAYLDIRRSFSYPFRKSLRKPSRANRLMSRTW